jgi:hypothetical protein
MTLMIKFSYVYSGGPRGDLSGAMSRKGQRCAVIARGAMNSARIVFEDGYEAIISRNALRKAPPPEVKS